MEGSESTDAFEGWKKDLCLYLTSSQSFETLSCSMKLSSSTTAVLGEACDLWACALMVASLSVLWRTSVLILNHSFMWECYSSWTYIFQNLQEQKFLCYVQVYISHFLIKPDWSYGLGTGYNGGFLTEAVEGLESWIGKHESKKRKASEECLSGWNYPSHETYSHVCPTALERRFALLWWAEEQLENHQRMPGSTEGS